MELLKRVILLLILLAPLSVNASSVEYKDNQIKAAFLYRLLHFIQWPHDIDQVNICIIGDNPFEEVQDQFEQQKFNNQHIKLQQIAVEHIASSSCVVAFVSESEKRQLQSIISALGNQPILTVSDIVQFAKSGGMVGFASFNSKIKLEINTQSLANAQFKIDPNLLEVALNVY